MSADKVPEHQRKRIEEISLFLKNWQINEGLSQREFSHLAEIHPNSAYNIGKLRLYNILTLLKCIDATGLTVSQFFEGMD